MFDAPVLLADPREEKEPELRNEPRTPQSENRVKVQRFLRAFGLPVARQDVISDSHGRFGAVHALINDQIFCHSLHPD